MDNIKAALQALQTTQQGTEQGWTWFFDESIGVICAQKGNTVRKVFMPHADSTDQQGSSTLSAQHDGFLITHTLNNLPMLVDALQRAVAFAEGLEEMAEMRERAAHNARRAERYDLFEAHRQSAKRVRTTKVAFLEKVGEAFAHNHDR